MSAQRSLISSRPVRRSHSQAPAPVASSTLCRRCRCAARACCSRRSARSLATAADTSVISIRVQRSPLPPIGATRISWCRRSPRSAAAVSANSGRDVGLSELDSIDAMPWARLACTAASRRPARIVGKASVSVSPISSAAGRWARCDSHWLTISMRSSPSSSSSPRCSRSARPAGQARRVLSSIRTVLAETRPVASSGHGWSSGPAGRPGSRGCSAN
mmetsp:Transcript_6866/g.16848  ORF Transcript_6866/g.16848 Transcript_6866/m.16848 type:complete len:217 (+) Transcript_6866:1040-1690(+)